VNYEQFADLLQSHKPKGLEIVAFPCNQFLGQEPWPPEQIKEFATDKGFLPGFTMTEKVNVNGTDAHPVYNFLKTQSGDTSAISWNFAKFLVRKDGTVASRHSPGVNPSGLVNEIDELLAQKYP